MAVLRFGDFPVNMEDPNFLPDLFGGDPILLEVTRSQIVVRWPDDSVWTVKGSFRFSSAKAFFNSRLDEIDSVDASGNLIFNLSNLKLRFKDFDDDLDALDRIPLIIFGSVHDDILIGGKGKDVLHGDAGNDRLSGFNGNDKLFGGDGDDVLFGGNGSDVLFGGPGNDRLEGENGKDKLFGEDGDDLLFGGNDSDVLFGGSGNDRLEGGNGKDKLFGEDGDDVLLGGNGKDLLIGGLGDDILDGGKGKDVMAGGPGDDKYWVDHSKDSVRENPDEGIDTVYSSVSYKLPANVENLFLTTDRDLRGVGNELDNHIAGNSGNNVLVGGAGNDTLNGGMGNDLLTGGLGQDIFRFDTPLGPNNIDTITDFQSRIDFIELHSLTFPGLGVGELGASFFVSGSGAIPNAGHAQILHDTATGFLSYDADGTGSDFSAVQFASVGIGTALIHSDIIVTV